MQINSLAKSAVTLFLAIASIPTLNAAVPIFYQDPDFTVNFNKNESLQNQFFPLKYRINANNDYAFWGGMGDQGLGYQCHWKNAADDWLISARIPVKPGYNYQIDISTSCNPTYPERLEAFVALQQTETQEGMTTRIVDPTVIESGTDITVTSQEFTATGEYFQLGIHAISDPNMADLFVHSVTVRETGQAQKPQELAISDIKVTTDTDGSLTAGYEYLADITIANNLGHTSQPADLTIEFGHLQEPVHLQIPAIEDGSTYTIATAFMPSLFEYEYFPIRATLSDAEGTPVEPLETEYVLNRPIHPAPRISDCVTPWQYLVVVVLVAPDTQRSIHTLGNRPTDDPGEFLQYNIYRDKKLIGHASAGSTVFLDNNRETSESEYQVNAQYENGISDLSEPLRTSVDTKVMSTVSDTAPAYVLNNRRLIATGGQAVTVTNASGMTVYANPRPSADRAITLAPGFYIITTPAGASKVIVR